LIYCEHKNNDGLNNKLDTYSLNIRNFIKSKINAYVFFVNYVYLGINLLKKIKKRWIDRTKIAGVSKSVKWGIGKELYSAKALNFLNLKVFINFYEFLYFFYLYIMNRIKK